MSEKNFIIKRKTNSGYDILYPKTMAEQVIGLDKIVVSNFQPESQPENGWWFDTVGEFSITNNLTHCTKVSGPTTIVEGESATLVFSAESGYEFQTTITVTGATANWTKSTGTLVLSNATSDISITVVAEFNPSAYSRVGGRIFYIHNDNGATYEFRTQSGSLISTQTIEGLENAYYYKITSGTPSADKFYVFNNELATRKIWGKMGTSIGMSSGIGTGKPNTEKCLAMTGWEDNSIWVYTNTCRTNQIGGCNDWYITSSEEQIKFRDVQSTLGITWYTGGAWIWTTEEYNGDVAYCLDRDSYIGCEKSYLWGSCFVARSF